MEHLFWCNKDQHLTTKKRAADTAKCDKCGDKVATIGFIEHAEQSDAQDNSAVKVEEKSEISKK